MAGNNVKSQIEDILQAYGVTYKALAKTLTDLISKELEAGKSIVESVNIAFNVADFHTGNADAVADAIYNAALTGLNIDPVIVAAAAKAELQKTLMETPWTGDGIKLSDRLHGVDNRIKSEIISTVSASMRNYDTVKVMTQKLYDGYYSGNAVLSKAELPAYMQKLRTSLLLSMNGDQRLVNQSKIIEKIAAMNIAGIKTPMLRATYKEALQALKSGKAEALEKALWVAAQEKSRYYAERIARTETARAYYDGFMAKIANDKDVVGVKWKLSSRHPFYDICNVYADADFGLGKGIFPKNKVPIIPVHPHCLCNLLEVYEGELDPNAKFSWDKGRQYIDTLPEKEQKTLFSKEKLAKYRSGGDWRKLAGDWQGEEFRQSRLMNTVENGIIIKRDKLIRGTYALDNNLIQDILNNELSTINMSAEPVYNSRIASPGRTIMSYLYGRVKVQKMEIGKQWNGYREAVIDSIIHEELEVRLLSNPTGLHKKLAFSNDNIRHYYINRVIARYFSMKGWKYELATVKK